MAETLITIERADLDALYAQLRAINDKLNRVEMQPKPEWITLRDYASRMDCHPSTVHRRVQRGELDTRIEGGTTMVRNPDLA